MTVRNSISYEHNQRIYTYSVCLELRCIVDKRQNGSHWVFTGWGLPQRTSVLNYMGVRISTRWRRPPPPRRWVNLNFFLFEYGGGCITSTHCSSLTLRRKRSVFAAVCLCVCFPRDITKLDIQNVFHDESWKSIYFGVNRSNVKVTSHNNSAVPAWVCALLWVLAFSIVVFALIHDQLDPVHFATPRSTNHSVCLSHAWFFLKFILFI